MDNLWLRDCTCSILFATCVGEKNRRGPALKRKRTLRALCIYCSRRQTWILSQNLETMAFMFTQWKTKQNVQVSGFASLVVWSTREANRAHQAPVVFAHGHQKSTIVLQSGRVGCGIFEWGKNTGQQLLSPNGDNMPCSCCLCVMFCLFVCLSSKPNPPTHRIYENKVVTKIPRCY